MEGCGWLVGIVKDALLGFEISAVVGVLVFHAAGIGCGVGGVGCVV